MAQLYKTEETEKDQRLQVLALAVQSWNKSEAFILHLGRLHQYYEEGVFITDFEYLPPKEEVQEEKEVIYGD